MKITQMPSKQGLINSDIKGKIVIKLCKKTWNLKKAPDKSQNTQMFLTL
jgi:hypothetical protein